jgi:hypothetical protein
MGGNNKKAAGSLLPVLLSLLLLLLLLLLPSVPSSPSHHARCSADDTWRGTWRKKTSGMEYTTIEMNMRCAILAVRSRSRLRSICCSGSGSRMTFASTYQVWWGRRPEGAGGGRDDG